MAKSIMIFFSKLFSMVFNYWSVGFQFTLMSVQLSQEAIVFRLFSILTTYILFKHREISILLFKKNPYFSVQFVEQMRVLQRAAELSTNRLWFCHGLKAGWAIPITFTIHRSLCCLRTKHIKNGLLMCFLKVFFLPLSSNTRRNYHSILTSKYQLRSTGLP